jgi:DNA-binding beta-propeller fold protein YncE
MSILKRLFSKSSVKSEESLKDLDEYEIYCSPLSSSYEEDTDSSSISSLQRGRHKLVIKVSDMEVLTQEVFIRQPPSLIRDPIYTRTMHGFDSIWRLAIDQRRGNIYTTNNDGSGAYSILSLQKGQEQLMKTVKCQYIWNIRGIAVDDSENVYVSGDYKVQKYDSDGQLVASIGWCEAGSAWYQFNDPNGVVCSGGCVYVCDSQNRRVQVLSTDLEHLTSIDNGSHLVHPEDLEIDRKGRIHVLDSGSLSVVVFDSEGCYIYHVNLPEDEALFPVSLSMVDGNYYVSDLSKSHIAVFSASGELLHKILVQSREDLKEDEDGFLHVDVSTTQRPLGLAVDYNGYIYVSNIDSREIQVF